MAASINISPRVVSGTNFTVNHAQDDGSGEATRPSSWPNSDAARAAWVTGITNLTTESFENYDDDTTGVGDGNDGTVTLGALSGSSVTFTSTSSEWTAAFGPYAGSIIKEVSGTGIATVLSRDSDTQLTCRVWSTFSSLTYVAGLLEVRAIGFYDATNGVAGYFTGNGAFINEVLSGTNGTGRFPTSGNRYLDFNSTTGFNFVGSEVSAVGFHAVDFGDFDARMVFNVTFTDASTEAIEIDYNYANVAGAAPYGGNVQFFGFKSSGSKRFRSITLSPAQGSSFDVFAVDQLSIAIASQLVMIGYPSPPGDLVCGPSLGPTSCPQECPIPTPTWSPVVYVASATGLVTGLSTCGHSLAMNSCVQA